MQSRTEDNANMSTCSDLSWNGPFCQLVGGKLMQNLKNKLLLDAGVSFVHTVSVNKKARGKCMKILHTIKIHWTWHSVRNIAHFDKPKWLFAESYHVTHDLGMHWPLPFSGPHCQIWVNNLVLLLASCVSKHVLSFPTSPIPWGWFWREYDFVLLNILTVTWIVQFGVLGLAGKKSQF